MKWTLQYNYIHKRLIKRGTIKHAVLKIPRGLDTNPCGVTDVPIAHTVFPEGEATTECSTNKAASASGGVGDSEAEPWDRCLGLRFRTAPC